MIPSFNKTPHIQVEHWDKACITGWESICKQLNRKLEALSGPVKTVVFECYQGVYHEEIIRALKKYMLFDQFIHSADSMLSHDEIDRLTYPDRTDNRIFGYLTRLNMVDLFHEKKLEAVRKKIRNTRQGTLLIYGHGAALLEPDPDILVYIDMARWEIQMRMRRNEVDNLGVSNKEESFEEQYKTGFFVDWRICDRLKKKLFDRYDYLLDTNSPGEPKLVEGEAIREGLRQAARQPFSVVPFFDPGPWGGQWMKDRFDLEKETENFAWCFNCVPEENSLFLKFGETRVEIPAINLVFYQPRELLGDPVHARFGDEFPIRFDYLDTMDGGNLSLQVHPLTEYIQEKFGMHYTQDESYYLLDAAEDASVYLGLKEEIDREEMIRELRKSDREGSFFEAEKYVEKWPAKKHDHFLIPAGTIHCSGKNSMVLEISATPYIFTFKLWDWDRKGLDGKPRPINVAHGLNVIQWDRTHNWVEKELIRRVVKVDEGPGWVEEKTGLHEREFMETRRHWFSKKVTHYNRGSVHVLNLVEGKEVIVESPSEAFKPFIVHYAETFIVPAAVGEYTIRPYGLSEGEQCATIKAYVRTNA